MIGLTGSFFFVELIVGGIIGSLALQADAFHMLSDLIAICMSFYAQIILQKGESNKATFGMIRADVIGGLINATFLLSSCFFITLEAIYRFIEFDEEHVDYDQIDALIIVGVIGLVINLIGIGMFSECTGHDGHDGEHGFRPVHGLGIQGDVKLRLSG